MTPCRPLKGGFKGWDEIVSALPAIPSVKYTDHHRKTHRETAMGRRETEHDDDDGESDSAIAIDTI